jgi:hypothetical protein
LVAGTPEINMDYMLLLLLIEEKGSSFYFSLA